MKTATEIRQENLNILKRDECDGRQGPMMEKLGRSQSQVSAMLNGAKIIGDSMARLIEERFSKPTGWLDNDHSRSNVVPLKRKEAPDMIEIPLLDATGSMGDGLAAPAHEQVADYLSLRRNFITENFSVSNPSALRLITGYGDSMADTIRDGDILLVDTQDTTIRTDAVFVLSRNSMTGVDLFIKRIQRMLDGSFMVISDNRAYEPYKLTEADLEDIRVCGRVVWVWNGKKL